MKQERSELRKHDDELVAVLTAAVAVCMGTDADGFEITRIKPIKNEKKTSNWSVQGLKSLMQNRL